MEESRIPLDVADYHDDGYDNVSSVTYAVRIRILADDIFKSSSVQAKRVMFKSLRDIRETKKQRVPVVSYVARHKIDIDDPMYEIAYAYLPHARNYFRKLLGNKDYLQISVFIYQDYFSANIVAPKSTLNYLKLKYPQKDYEP